MKREVSESVRGDAFLSVCFCVYVHPRPSAVSSSKAAAGQTSASPPAPPPPPAGAEDKTTLSNSPQTPSPNLPPQGSSASAGGIDAEKSEPGHQLGR